MKARPEILTEVRVFMSTQLKDIADEMHQKSMAARDWVFQVIRTAIIRGVLPGGMPGAVNLANDAGVRSLVLAMNDAKKVIAAICASPAVAFAAFDVLKGKNYTCYPGMEKEVSPEKAGNWKADRVVVDGNLVTSRGPGTAGEFGFALVDVLLGSGASAQLKKGMLCV